MATYSYHPICRECKGEGTFEELVPSIGGVGGAALQTVACRACKGSGTDYDRTISWEEDEDEEDAA